MLRLRKRIRTPQIVLLINKTTLIIKSYFITALAVCLALVTAQAQEAVVKRTTARKAAKMAPSERFVRVAKARGGEGTVVQKAATLPITPD